MKRREFIRGGIGTFMAGLTLPLDRFIADYKPENVSKVNGLEELGEIIRRGQPAEVLYDLGEGEERTELLVTYIDGDSRTTNRIASSPQIRLYKDGGGTLMDITDPDENGDGYAYRNLRPRGAVFEQPNHPPHELGEPTEVLYDLGEGKERTELLVTYIDGNSRTTNRIASSPQIRLYEDRNGTLMDITDSDENGDRYLYRNLRPLGAKFEMPSRPSDESGYDELGNLTVNLGDGRQLGFSHYKKAE